MTVNSMNNLFILAILELEPKYSVNYALRLKWRWDNIVNDDDNDIYIFCFRCKYIDIDIDIGR